MRNLYLDTILKVIKGQLFFSSGNPLISNVSARSTRIKDNTAYFDLRCIKPEFKNYKGVVVITDKPWRYLEEASDIVVVWVDNIKEAYWTFVDYYRNLFDIPIIGLTGTCGKTTTKEIIKHILSFKYKVHANYKSNNAAYLDLNYLLGIDDSTQAGVFEMGVAYPNDLVNSCKYYQPQIRVILNIGVYHLTGCKTPEAYLQAKAKMIDGINEVNGTLILNADDENIKKIDVSNIKRIIYFGLGEESDFRAKNIAYSNNGMSFTLCFENKEYDGFIAGLGEHSVYNALAAIAASYQVGMDIKEIIRRLASFKNVEEHLQVKVGVGNCTIIDDTWSSAPISTHAALKLIKEFACGRKKVVILGIMPQLDQSSYSNEEYKKIGSKVVDSQVDQLITIGEEAGITANEAIALGLEESKVFISLDGSGVYDIVKSYLNNNSVILLKVTHRQMKSPILQELKGKIIIS